MQRVLQHRAGEGGEFTRRYRVHRLVYFQSFHNVGDAIARETELKKWRREKKIALIEERNPPWEDLAEGWGGPAVMRVVRTADSSLRSEWQLLNPCDSGTLCHSETA
jgi:putative endonuclease